MKKDYMVLLVTILISFFLISCQESGSENLSLAVEDSIILDRNKNFMRVGRFGKWGFLDDETRTLAIALQYVSVGHFSEYLAPAAIVQNGQKKWGYIDTLGRWVIPPAFDEAKDFSEGLAGVKDGDYWGFVNHLGLYVIEPKFVNVYQFSEGLAGVFDEKEQFEYIDKNGNVLIQKSGMTDGSSFSNRLAGVIVNWKYGFIDRDGCFVIQPQYGNVKAFSDGLAAVKVGSFFEGKWGYIDENNKMIISPQYDYAEKFENGYARVALNDRYFIIDKEGNKVSDTYDRIWDYYDGLAPVLKNGKWGFVNHSGQITIPLQFDEIVPYGFNNGHCWVYKGDYMIKIDRKGNVLMSGLRN